MAAVVAATVAATVLSATPAAAAPAPDYEAPFTCGAQWVGTTRSGHSPSYYSVDFNRPDDIGDLVVSTAPGLVTRVADTGSSSYGKYVIVDHGNGDTSLYAHMLAQYVVAGQRVDQGTSLGLVGTSGGSTGPHLHFEEKAAGSVQPPYFHQERYAFGTTLTSRNCGDVPMAGDWDDRRGEEVAVFRRKAGTGMFRLFGPGGAVQRVPWGHPGDSPVSGDWDGNGRTDVGVRAAGSNTFVLRSASGAARSLSLGEIGDQPVAGDWNGDGTTEIGVWRPADHAFRLRLASGAVKQVSLGSTGSLPVTGDWNGDGTTNVGVFNASTGSFTLRVASSSGASVRTVRLGTSTHLPVTGDWNGDGFTDVGVWSPTTRRFTLRTLLGGDPARTSTTTQLFGRPRVT
jgi:hypothetical protein